MVEIGDLVKDKITGFTGIVLLIVYWQYNCARVKLQPIELSNDGYVKATETFDIMQVEIVEKHKITGEAITDLFKFEFNQMVEDIVTGFRGKVYGYTYHLNGCTRVAVMSLTLKDGKPQDEEWFPQAQLRLIEENKVKEKQVRTGGPMRDVPNMRMPK